MRKVNFAKALRRAFTRLREIPRPFGGDECGNFCCGGFSAHKAQSQAPDALAEKQDTPPHKRVSFTLAEALVVVTIISLLVGAVLKFLQASQRSWFSGRDHLTESRQARMAIAEMDRLLRQSNPSWDATHGVVISDANRRIDFYIPNFYSDCCPGCADPALCTDTNGAVHTRGELMSLSKVTFKLNPNNSAQLLEKVGNNPERVIANNVNSVNFSCGCSGCIGVDDSCPAVFVSITTFIQAQHTLTTRTELRNQNITAQAGVVIEEPPQGGF